MTTSGGSVTIRSVPTRPARTAGDQDPGKEVTGPVETNGSSAVAVVLDTSVLVSDPDVLFAFGDADVVLPLTVIEELDKHKTRLDEVGWAARTTIRTLEELRMAAGGHLGKATPLRGGGTVRVELNGLRLEVIIAHGLDPARPDNRILAAALGLMGDGVSVKLVSSDAALRLKAAQFGLVAEDYLRNAPADSLGAGWSSRPATSELIDSLYADGSASVETLEGSHVFADDGTPRPVPPMVINEYVVLKSPSNQSVLARRKGDRLERVREHCEPWGLTPRSKEQRFALDLLMDPSVDVVALVGHAGTGKTIMALAAGMEQVVGTPTYASLGVFRPIVPVGKHDLGFLPGDLDEKIGPWMLAINDNMVALTENRSRADAAQITEEMRARRQLEFGSIAHIRGRSISRSFLLVDEAQNLEVGVLKALLTRVSEGTKIVFTGDISQIDSPYLSRTNNAMSALIDAFRGQDCFGHVVLTQGERSRVAELAAKLL